MGELWWVRKDYNDLWRIVRDWNDVWCITTNHRIATICMRFQPLRTHSTHRINVIVYGPWWMTMSYDKFIGEPNIQMWRGLRVVFSYRRRMRVEQRGMVAWKNGIRRHDKTRYMMIDDYLCWPHRLPAALQQKRHWCGLAHSSQSQGPSAISCGQLNMGIQKLLCFIF